MTVFGGQVEWGSTVLQGVRKNTFRNLTVTALLYSVCYCQVVVKIIRNLYIPYRLCYCMDNDMAERMQFLYTLPQGRASLYWMHTSEMIQVGSKIITFLQHTLCSSSCLDAFSSIVYGCYEA